MPGTITVIRKSRRKLDHRRSFVNLSPAQVNCVHARTRVVKVDEDEKTEQCLSCGVTIHTITEHDDEDYALAA